MLDFKKTCAKFEIFWKMLIYLILISIIINFFGAKIWQPSLIFIIIFYNKLYKFIILNIYPKYIVQHSSNPVIQHFLFFKKWTNQILKFKKTCANLTLENQWLTFNLRSNFNFWGGGAKTFFENPEFHQWKLRIQYLKILILIYKNQLIDFL